MSGSDANRLGTLLLNEVGDANRFKENEYMYYKSHLVFIVVDELARNKSILEWVCTILGTRDVLLWDSSVPIKPPAKPEEFGGFFPWHQDATYWGLDPVDSVVTCWVALSTSKRLNGCMRVALGTHRQGQLIHRLSPSASAMVRRGQTVDGVDEDSATHIELCAGEMSMHHPRLLHASDVNQSTEHRIGVVLNY